MLLLRLYGLVWICLLAGHAPVMNSDWSFLTVAYSKFLSPQLKFPFLLHFRICLIWKFTKLFYRPVFILGVLHASYIQSIFYPLCSLTCLHLLIIPLGNPFLSTRTMAIFYFNILILFWICLLIIIGVFWNIAKFLLWKLLWFASSAMTATTSYHGVAIIAWRAVAIIRAQLVKGFKL